MATYGIIMCVVYIIGLPVTVFVLLYRRRNLLFGNPRDPAVAAVRRKYGFLYLIYGKNAWFWETEELVRKLLLSAVVVLFDSGTPLQITLAVLISSWAHVLHAVFKVRHVIGVFIVFACRPLCIHGHYQSRPRIDRGSRCRLGFQELSTLFSTPSGMCERVCESLSARVSVSVHI